MLLTLKGVEPTAIGEGFIGLWLHGEHQRGELQFLVDAQAILLDQLAADVPEGGHIRIDQQRHIEILGKGIALLLLLQCAQLLLLRLAAVRDKGAMGVVVHMLGTPRLESQIVVHMHHRRLIAVRLLWYDLKRGSARKRKRESDGYRIYMKEYIDEFTDKSASLVKTAFMSRMIFSHSTFFSLLNSAFVSSSIL